MKCPKCGYLRQAKDNDFIPGNECPSCGIVYNKLEKSSTSKTKEPETAPPLQTRSPVSASSLRKARERIDRRLRKNRDAKVGDLRHIQTLEMARRLSAEGVRQRQAEWKKRNNKQTTSTATAEESLDNQPDPESSNHPFVEAEPQKTTNQLATTIVKALNKNKITPEQDDETGMRLVHPVKTTRASHAIESDTMDENMPLSQKDSIERSTRQPGTEDTPAPNKPTQLSHSKVKAKEKGKTKTPSLKEMLKDYDPPDSKKTVPAKSFNLFRNFPVSGLMELLPLVAWLILGAGVIGTILSWTTMGDVQAAMQPPTPKGNNPLPLGLLLGFAYLATGVLGFAFFWVSSLISNQLKDIRRLLLLHPVSQADDKADHPTEAE